MRAGRAGRGWGVSYSITQESNLRSNVLNSDPHILDHLLQTLSVCVFYDDVFVLLPLLWLYLPVMMMCLYYSHCCGCVCLL